MLYCKSTKTAQREITMYKILLVLLLIPALASADDVYLTLGGWSVHSDKGYHIKKGDIVTYKDYNSNHKALIVDYKGFTVGTYENSYSNRTNLIGYTYRHKNISLVSAIATGYTDINVNGESCSIKIEKGCAIFSIGYSLSYLKVTYMLTSISLAFEFKL